MRQLDLFGSVINPPAVEDKKHDEVPEIHLEEQTAGDNSEVDETGNEPQIISEEISIFTTEEEVIPEVEIEVSSSETVHETVPLVVAEDVDHPGSGTENEVDIIKETTTEINERAEAKANESSEKEKQQVVFNNGKISVKIKQKAIAEEANEAVPKKVHMQSQPQKRGRKSFKTIEADIDLVEIPEDDVLFKKQYYSISEVAGWFRVNTSLLRFWENEFDILKPRKNRKGDRLFRPEDVKNLQLIYHLLRQRKYTIEGAKEYIKSHRKEADIQLQLINTLQKFKSFLLDLKANLQP